MKVGRGSLFLALVLLTCSSLPAMAAVHNVTVQNFSFDPADISVAQGDTVVWTNLGGSHNVHHTGNPSLFGRAVGSGWTYTFVFNLDAGRYDYVCEPHASMGMTGSVTVTPLAAPDRPLTSTVRDVTLGQNYPNPFNSRTEIEFSVPTATNARLTVLNLLGQEVAEPFRGPVSAGQHRVAFDASTLTAGIYFYRLEAGNTVRIRTMQFIK
jgi:plastocyanin